MNDARHDDIAQNEAARPPRRISGRLVRPREDGGVGDLDAFDDQFWRAMTGEQRVEALWGMVLDSIAIQGGNADDQPGLQRSVGRIVRP